MSTEEILAELTPIFRDVLDNEKISISAATAASDIAEWDSLSHIQLVVAIEKHFSIRFTSREIQSWTNVGDMITCMQSK
jgi:acyl carrier protein